MDYISILDLKPVITKDMAFGDNYVDLNLDQIIEAISKIWGSSVKDFYRYFPPTKEAVIFRQDVIRDIEENALYDTLFNALSSFSECKNISREKEKSRQNVRREVMHAEETALFCDAICALYDGLKDKSLNSEGLCNIFNALSELVASDNFLFIKEQSQSFRKEFSKLRIVVSYEGKKLVVGDSVSFSDYSSDLSSLAPENAAKYGTLFGDSLELIGLEKEIMLALIKKNPEVFKKASLLYAQNRNYCPDWVSLFFDELPFYLSFLKFMKTMTDNGAGFCFPSFDKKDSFKASGLYDLALFNASLSRNTPVIANDFSYDNDECFFVLTGPNQGGKTTFARSLGQLVFFAKMGLKVPAASANVFFFSKIVTHFSVEESVETGRGKLMEELVRLAPMMKDADGGSFVIINELFTTAANYDACIMGKRVLSHFIGQGSFGIYVTHLSELLDSEPKAAGLCAQLDENGRQTFKIKKAIMEYTNCASNQVDKYGLSYEKLKERLS